MSENQTLSGQVYDQRFIKEMGRRCTMTKTTQTINPYIIGDGAGQVVPSRCTGCGHNNSWCLDGLCSECGYKKEMDNDWCVCDDCGVVARVTLAVVGCPHCGQTMEPYKEEEK